MVLCWWFVILLTLKFSVPWVIARNIPSIIGFLLPLPTPCSKRQWYLLDQLCHGLININKEPTSARGLPKREFSIESKPGSLTTQLTSILSKQGTSALKMCWVVRRSTPKYKGYWSSWPHKRSKNTNSYPSRSFASEWYLDFMSCKDAKKLMYTILYSQVWSARRATLPPRPILGLPPFLPGLYHDALMLCSLSCQQ